MTAETSETRLLVVEDDALLRMAIVRMLGQAGLLCDSAGDGQEALECMRATTYALIITDIRMPKMSGFELIRASSMLGYGTPFVVLSGYHDKVDLGAADRHVVRMLTKPILPQALRDVVTEVLASGVGSG